MLLPQPLGPMMATNSPCGMCRLTPLSAWTAAPFASGPAVKLGGVLDADHDSPLLLRHLLHEVRRRFARHQLDDLDPRAAGRAAPRASSGLSDADGVVAALDVDIGPHRAQESRRAHVGENRHRIDHAPGGEQFRAVRLRHERTARPLQFAHRGVAVEADPEEIAQRARLGQVAQWPTWSRSKQPLVATTLRRCLRSSARKAATSSSVRILPLTLVQERSGGG